MVEQDTIFALATPPGKSGVAVIRLSGQASKWIAESLAGDIEKPRFAYFRALRDESGTVLDEGLVLYFQAPNSFTGEDVVELQIHGSRAAIAAVSAEIQRLGGRPALSGEFTRRALENGKLDMLQVEALGDFIEADTEGQRRRAILGVRGAASAWVDDLREKLVETMSLVTAAIDFSDEELPADLDGQILQSLEGLIAAVDGECARANRAKSMREGYRVVIIGQPNTGKSSLLNALAGRDVAITTDIPGTTRDILEVFLDINGLPVILMDTAGLHETDNHVEQIGIIRAQQAAESADLRIFLWESDKDFFGIVPRETDIVLRSKADIYGEENDTLSAKTGFGIDTLLQKLEAHFAEHGSDVGFFAHERQVEVLNSALASLESAKDLAAQDHENYDILAEDLRQAMFALDRLIGRVDVEDMLDVIFSKFCIGK